MLSLSLGSSMTLFDVSEVEKAMNGLESQSSNSDGLRRVYKKMLESGPQRWVCKPASAAPLEQVMDDCPNFRGVLEDLSNHIELAVVNKRGLAMIPVLLAGAPGVGKTHFAKQLAKSLGLSYQFLSMGTMSAGWVLGGSAPTWSGARHGKIAASLIEGDFGNPLYLLDELDKTGGDSRFDPYGALLQLLERDTAQHFKDEYLDVSINASAIVWVATANDISLIPDYILSRMAVYEVPAPSQDEAFYIAQRIYDGLRAELDWAFEPELPAALYDLVTEIAPRDMRKKLLDAMACAVRGKRTQLLAAHIKATHVKQARSIGFTA
ncbi:AAA family ATPase [Burkholderia ubonensis]|nr:AAA family ATPase [Burkholderia ubonensis]